MHYRSTRHDALYSFNDAVMAGLAPDGGLFVPEKVPVFDRYDLKSISEIVRYLVDVYAEGVFTKQELTALIDRSFSRFTDSEVTPLRKVGSLWLMELFHGPTFAFKDIALQFLGQLYGHYNAQHKTRVVVLGATSGDTGSAAMAGLQGIKDVDVFILYPKDGISPMQELQMTTMGSANIFPIAIEGSFDDGQLMVKTLFADTELKNKYNLRAVNSINWCRILVQMAYYIYAGVKLSDGGKRSFNVAVPTGNFGNIYAAHLVKRMGLPLQKVILATNANAVLHNFFISGTYRRSNATQTHSPSMDIQLASNFERYLFELAEGDHLQLSQWMQEIQQQGELKLPQNLLKQAQQDFVSGSVSDEETLSTINSFYNKYNYILDPHGAVAVTIAQEHLNDINPMAVMLTAHPAKFSGAVKMAIGHEPDLPPALAELSLKHQKKLHCSTDINSLKKLIEKHVQY